MGQTAQKIQTMGEESHPNKYSEIIEGLKSNKFKNITFITGAGISTSAGIPDFRSKGGLFAQTQQKYNLSSPEQFFQINLLIIQNIFMIFVKVSILMIVNQQ